MPKDTSKSIDKQMLPRAAAAARVGAALSSSSKVASKSKKSATKEASGSKADLGTPSPAIPPSVDVKAALDTLERDTMGESWYDVLQPEFKKPYFLKLKDFLVAEHKANTIFPAMSNIYAWSRLTSLDSVKVVILGQDPYHDVGQAHGLSFSVLPPTKAPPSLKNIYKQMANDLPSFVIPTSGDLTPLAKLGVLWINASLTVRAHKAASHSGKGWETFTAEVIRAVTLRKNGRGVVFLAWGLPAQKTCAKIGIDEEKNLVLKSAHPSPLSAHRGFLGNGHFLKANEWLREKYGKGEEINWAALCA